MSNLMQAAQPPITTEVGGVYHAAAMGQAALSKRTGETELQLQIVDFDG
jgi:hypothetical protein